MANLDAFEPPPTGGVYAAMIWDAVGAWSPDNRAELGARLMRSGARDIVCGGLDCEAWHDDMDQGIWRANSQGDEAFVMTVWMTGETEQETAWNLRFVAFHQEDEEGDFDQFSVIQIGGAPEVAERLKAAITTTESLDD